MTFRCGSCGSDQVQESCLAWFWMNGGDQTDDETGSAQDTYCCGCGENGIEIVESRKLEYNAKTDEYTVGRTRRGETVFLTRWPQSVPPFAWWLTVGDELGHQRPLKRLDNGSLFLARRMGVGR